MLDVSASNGQTKPICRIHHDKTDQPGYAFSERLAIARFGKVEWEKTAIAVLNQLESSHLTLPS
jgi:hypothetical protein